MPPPFKSVELPPLLSLSPYETLVKFSVEQTQTNKQLTSDAGGGGGKRERQGCLFYIVVTKTRGKLQ